MLHYGSVYRCGLLPFLINALMSELREHGRKMKEVPHPRSCLSYNIPSVSCNGEEKRVETKGSESRL